MQNQKKRSQILSISGKEQNDSAGRGPQPRTEMLICILWFY